VVFGGLMRQRLFVEVFRALANSLAAEHFTRMLTLGAAEGNIEGHLDAIRLEYQTRRQTEITDELIDIVVGAEVSAPERRRRTP
jgi:F-type H+-transporting ATPase subunit gamma